MAFLALYAMAMAIASPAPAAPAMIVGTPPGVATSRLVIPVAVFGEDGRQLLDGRRRGLSDYIGLLHHRGTGSACTAFCLATNVIATAGHCVQAALDGDRRDVGGWQFSTDAARGAGSSGDSSTIASAPGAALPHVMTGAAALNTRPPINASADWAMLRLNRPACRRGGLALSAMNSDEISARSRAGQVFHISYHRDFRDWQLATSAPCHVNEVQSPVRDLLATDFEDGQNLLLHDCDTGAASSGSPLLVDGENGPEVVGINVGTYVRSRVITHDGEIIQRLSSETIANTALRTAPLRERFAAFEHAELVSRSADVRLIEQRLKARGLFAGEPDRTFGADTRAAVMAYERTVGAIVTGLPTRALLDALAEQTASVP